ncbi:MAG: hypothetical protein DMG14_23110 [Acidobacteria bacterium]|nr:MAG: hypothetical protein DMG14_23110 [Acidobacteriota bacterium]
MMNRLIGEGKTGITTNAVYDSWTPARAYQHYHGAVRILTEAASVQYASPIKQNFSDLRPGVGYDPRTISWKFPALWRGGEWHLRDIVDYELTAAMGALENMAFYRERWLRNFYTVQKRAVSWNSVPFAFVIPPEQRDPVSTVEMLNILQFGEVEVERADSAFTADGVQYPKGSYVIRVAQPFGAFAKTMMERQAYPDLREYPGTAATALRRYRTHAADADGRKSHHYHTAIPGQSHQSRKDQRPRRRSGGRSCESIHPGA